MKIYRVEIKYSHHYQGVTHVAYAEYQHCSIGRFFGNNNSIIIAYGEESSGCGMRGLMNYIIDDLHAS